MNNELKAYRDRWLAVAEIERQELMAASIEEKWRQLNAAIGLAIGMGLMVSDQSEVEVYQRWARLKDQITNLKKTA